MGESGGRRCRTNSRRFSKSLSPPLCNEKLTPSRCRRVVAEMGRVGMLVDLSHTGGVSALEALEMATRPAIFSHSNAAAVAESFRNVTDAHIRACAETGGVIGISGSSVYLGDPDCATETI